MKAPSINEEKKAPSSTIHKSELSMQCLLQWLRHGHKAETKRKQSLQFHCSAD